MRTLLLLMLSTVLPNVRFYFAARSKFLSYLFFHLSIRRPLSSNKTSNSCFVYLEKNVAVAVAVTVTVAIVVVLLLFIIIILIISRDIFFDLFLNIRYIMGLIWDWINVVGNRVPIVKFLS